MARPMSLLVLTTRLMLWLTSLWSWTPFDLNVQFTTGAAFFHTSQLKIHDAPYHTEQSRAWSGGIDQPLTVWPPLLSVGFGLQQP